MLDVDVDEVGAGIEVVIPHVLADLRTGEGLAGRAKQVGEQGELARGEFDGGGATTDFAGNEIYREFAVLENARLIARRAAEDGVEAGDELFDVERF